MRVREFLHCIPWAEGDEKGGGGWDKKGRSRDEIGKGGNESLISSLLRIIGNGSVVCSVMVAQCAPRWHDLLSSGHRHEASFWLPRRFESSHSQIHFAQATLLANSLFRLSGKLNKLLGV